MSGNFLSNWAESAYTTSGFFWSALWAFALGYWISSLIQVFVTRERMKNAMGGSSVKEVALAGFFGFISSSCSFAALATTKSLFKKGAGFIPSLAFLLASTNLVIELGIVISVFLTWQFVVGEYVGGILLILFMWLLVSITRPSGLIKKTRQKLSKNKDSSSQENDQTWLNKMKEKSAWGRVGMHYQMEWGMVWKDVTIGFTVAGIIAVFVPREFYESLFIGIDQTEANSFLQILEHTLIGPVVAFMTFIGSMGNIPLAAVLFDNGVSFAGVMAFIFSDLVVFPVLRINARYYGWKMSFYILAVLLVALVGTTLILHYGMQFLDFLPDSSQTSPMKDRIHFKLNYTFYLNIIFLFISGLLIYFKRKWSGGHHGHQMADKGNLTESVLRFLAYISFAWLLGGLILHFFVV